MIVSEQKAREGMKITVRKLIIAISLFLGLWWLYSTNKYIKFTHYSLSFTSLPQSFNRFKIAHLSDFHNHADSHVRESIIARLIKEKPDIIVITGDIVDSRTPNINVALKLVEGLTKIAPTYYVIGNHEARLIDRNIYDELEADLLTRGVNVLRDEQTIFTKNNEHISIVGIDDPRNRKANSSICARKINELATHNHFTLLLSHRPEYYDVYKQSVANLVFSGHVHGGQVRLPFIGGVIAPHQGFFPKYDGGVYREYDFAMVVSRGIGNSLFPLRINNQPEVIIVELRNEN